MYVKYNTGFTLLELMLVVAIVAIIAAIAVPSYQDQVRRAKRTDAQAFLLDISAQQERFFTQNISYASDLNNIGGTTSPEGHYTASITVTPAGCDPAGATNCVSFQLTATPNGADPECLTITYSNLGVKGNTGTGDVNDCWR